MLKVERLQSSRRLKKHLLVLVGMAMDSREILWIFNTPVRGNAGIFFRKTTFRIALKQSATLFL